jgi:hypothetical protein
MSDYDSTNPRHIAIQRREAKASDEARGTFINTIMGMVNGRAYVHDLLVRCHVFAQPFSADALLTAFACGELNVGQRVLADVMLHCPDNYITMMREANARDIAIANRLSRSDADANGHDRGPEPYTHPGADTGDDSPSTADSDEARGFGREDRGE